MFYVSCFMLNSFLKPLYHDIKTLILDTLFPIYCLSCEKEGEKFVCDDCQLLLSRLEHQFCIVCQKPALGGLTHPKCQSPFIANGLVSLFDYTDEKVADILIKGKYSFLPKVYKELGEIIADAIKKDFPYLLPPTPYSLIPIPLNKWRQRWRGFNQANILAISIGESLSLPIVDALIRKKFTKTQKNLKKADRIKNLESAFALNSFPSPSGRGIKGEGTMKQ